MPTRQRKNSILRKDASEDPAAAAAAAATNEGKTSRSRRREVCWGDLEVYEFASILGDNPSAVEGSPLTLSWKMQDKHIIGIDYQEFLRKDQRRKRKDLYIPGAERDTYLLSLGYSLKQLLKLAEENENIRRSRQQNMKGRFASFSKVFTIAMKSSKVDKAGSAVVPKPNILASPSG